MDYFTFGRVWEGEMTAIEMSAFPRTNLKALMQLYLFEVAYSVASTQRSRSSLAQL